MNQVRPAFVFSLPRCGSTLLQRMLAANRSIATMSEPWALLPLLHAPVSRSTYADYDHAEYVKATDDFWAQLPGGVADYREAVRRFAAHLYQRASGESAVYFLDKTPRYHLIVREIIAAFPDAKFIFLWRHPLAVAASMMRTWSAGRWNLYRFEIDLYTGLANLVQAYRDHVDTVCAIRYEDLVTDTESQVRRLMSFMELPYEAGSAGVFDNNSLRGRMGDKSGIQSYETVRSAPLAKWPDVMGNPLRRAWAKRYVEWIGEARLATMGYSIAAIRAELRDTPQSLRFVGSDLVRMTLGPVRQALGPLGRASGRSCNREA